MPTKGTVPEKKAVERKSAWLRVLAAGLGLYAAGIGIAIVTGSPVLFRTVAPVGILAAPAAFATYFFERWVLSRLPVLKPVVVRRTRQPGEKDNE